MENQKIERNYNIDILRALCTLLIVVYHSWVQCGSVPFSSSLITTMVSLGGEIGVTAFFALSGYGIYCSLHNSMEKGGTKFCGFMKKRVQRIVPQYYLCLLVVLLFTDGAKYLEWGHLDNIVTHLFLVHNLIPEHFGAINGVLWTLGVIFQFYLISILLFKGFQKWGSWVYIATTVFTIGMKVFVYGTLLPSLVADTSLNFFAGRQLFTALDNFTIGMLIAHLVVKRGRKPSNIVGVVGTILGCVLLMFICYTGLSKGIHSNNISGYLWHSAVALVLGVMMWMFSGIAIPKENVITKGVLWISKYEYGIYLWHLVMINTLIAKSPFVNQLLTAGYRKTVYIIFTVLSVIIGYVFSKMTENVDFCKKTCKKKQEELV